MIWIKYVLDHSSLNEFFVNADICEPFSGSLKIPCISLTLEILITCC